MGEKTREKIQSYLRALWDKTSSIYKLLDFAPATASSPTKTEAI